MSRSRPPETEKELLAVFKDPAPPVQLSFVEHSYRKGRSLLGRCCVWGGESREKSPIREKHPTSDKTGRKNKFKSSEHKSRGTVALDQSQAICSLGDLVVVAVAVRARKHGHACVSA